jgi:hypothetical protein
MYKEAITIFVCLVDGSDGLITAALSSKSRSDAPNQPPATQVAGFFSGSGQGAEQPKERLMAVRRRRYEFGQTDAPSPAMHSRRHLITSSAIARKVAGIVTPIAFAVLRLTTSSNLVGYSTGRSPGLAPRRMRSTKDAVRNTRSVSRAP